ncbi:hypothetical protein OF83DRAFT_1105607 [Amylostereum chailletii]|nr:hypothetical protein OF83DRAFT_1105607 [Amylostereum chailletii]
MPRKPSSKMAHATLPAPVHTAVVDQLGPLLPTELTYDIIGMVLAVFLSDLLLLPQSAKEWDAVLILLKVSRTFRACTVKYMTVLWGGDFPLGHKSDYKKSISLLRRYSELAHTFPNHLFEVPVPRFLNNRAIRKPRVPIIGIIKSLLSCFALSRLWTDDMMDFTEPPDITIPVCVRHVLFPHLEDYTVSMVLPWARAMLLRGTLETLHHLFLGITLAEFSFLEDSDDMMEVPKDYLHVSEVFMGVVTDVVEVFGLPLEVIDRDIVSNEFGFQYDVWSAVMETVKHVETLTHGKKKACMIWKRSFALLMSKADRERVMPDFSMDESLE